MDNSKMGDNTGSTQEKVAANTFRAENYFTVVYVDGSCKDNGGEKATASYGVFWGDDNPRNKEGVINGQDSPTNNRAELEAAIQALQQANSFKIEKLEVIRSDSRYVTSGMNEWIHNWKSSNTS